MNAAAAVVADAVVAAAAPEARAVPQAKAGLRHRRTPDDSQNFTSITRSLPLRAGRPGIVCVFFVPGSPILTV